MLTRELNTFFTARDFNKWLPRNSELLKCMCVSVWSCISTLSPITTEVHCFCVCSGSSLNLTILLSWHLWTSGRKDIILMMRMKAMKLTAMMKRMRKMRMRMIYRQSAWHRDKPTLNAGFLPLLSVNERKKNYIRSISLNICFQCMFCFKWVATVCITQKINWISGAQLVGPA